MIGKMIHDFKCSQPKEMYSSNLQERIKYLKENPEGVEEMCEAMEKIRQDDMRRNNMKKDVLHIRNVIESFNVTVEKAMDVFHIPNDDRTVVAQLVSSQTYYR